MELIHYFSLEDKRRLKALEAWDRLRLGPEPRLKSQSEIGPVSPPALPETVVSWSNTSLNTASNWDLFFCCVEWSCGDNARVCTSDVEPQGSLRGQWIRLHRLPRLQYSFGAQTQCFDA